MFSVISGDWSKSIGGGGPELRGGGGGGGSWVNLFYLKAILIQ